MELNSGIARLTCAGGLHEIDATQLTRRWLKRSKESPLPQIKQLTEVTDNRGI